MEKDKQDLIRTLKKANKESLFLPIFFTIIFGSAILGVIYLPAEEVGGSKLPYLILLPLFIIIYWFLYILGKRNQKQMSLAIEELETTGDEEHEHFSQEQSDRLQTSFKSITRYLIYFYIALLVVSLYNVLNQFIEITGWLAIAIGIVLFANLCLSLLFGILKYIKVFRYVKSITEE